jgi:hypothetical protein
MLADPKQMQSVEAGPVMALLRQGLGADAVPELGTLSEAARSQAAPPGPQPLSGAQ